MILVRCRDCGTTHSIVRNFCRNCLSENLEELHPEKGVVRESVLLNALPEGFTEPYYLVVVEVMGTRFLCNSGIPLRNGQLVFLQDRDGVPVAAAGMT